jgi:hypothetical protein
MRSVVQPPGDPSGLSPANRIERLCAQSTPCGPDFFDNPAPMVADYPTAYEEQPGFDFFPFGLIPKSIDVSASRNKHGRHVKE